MSEQEAAASEEVATTMSSISTNPSPLSSISTCMAISSMVGQLISDKIVWRPATSCYQHFCNRLLSSLRTHRLLSSLSTLAAVRYRVCTSYLLQTMRGLSDIHCNLFDCTRSVPTLPFCDWLKHWLTHSLKHSLTDSLTHSLAHSLAQTLALVVSDGSTFVWQCPEDALRDRCLVSAVGSSNLTIQSLDLGSERWPIGGAGREQGTLQPVQLLCLGM